LPIKFRSSSGDGTLLLVLVDLVEKILRCAAIH
jgi:hypothetical protein